MKRLIFSILLLMLMTGQVMAYGTAKEDTSTVITFVHSVGMDSVRYYASQDTTSWEINRLMVRVFAGDSMSYGLIDTFDNSGTYWVKIEYWEGGAASAKYLPDIRDVAPTNADVNVASIDARVITLAVFDTAAIATHYGFAIWVDDGASNTNTTVGIDGTLANPVSTLAAARILADSMDIHRYNILNASSFTLATTYENWIFSDVGSGATIDLGSQDVDGSSFLGLMITGIQGGNGTIGLVNCQISDLHDFDGRAEFCWLVDSLVMDNNSEAYFGNCYSAVAGNGTPKIDFHVASNSIGFRNYSGGINIVNMSSNDKISIEGNGQIIVDATCSNAPITARGNFTITDNGSGTVWTRDAVFSRQEADSWVWANVDTSLPDSSEQGVWLVNNLSGAASGLDTLSTVFVARLVDEISSYAFYATKGAVGGTPGVTGFSSVALTEANDDHWKDNMFAMFTGTGTGQASRITAFTTATDSITFAPAFKFAPTVGDSFFVFTLISESGSASGVDSTGLSNILHRIVWGTPVGSGSDSSTGAQRDIGVDLSNYDGATPLVVSDNIGINWGNVASPGASVNLAATTVNAITAQVSANVTAISGDATAADNAELMFDGTGYVGGTIVFKADISKVGGDAIVDNNDGLLEVNVEKWKDQVPLDPAVSGAIQANVYEMVNDVITADKIADNAFTGDQLATSFAVKLLETDTSAIDAGFAEMLKDTTAYQGDASGLSAAQIWQYKIRDDTTDGAVDDTSAADHLYSASLGGGGGVGDSTIARIDSTLIAVGYSAVSLSARLGLFGTLDRGSTDSTAHVEILKIAEAVAAAGAGTGEFACSLLAYNGSAFISPAEVRMISGVQEFRVNVSPEGWAVFALDGGTWIAYITALRFLQDTIPQTFTFSADYTDTLTMTGFTPSAPAGDLTTLYNWIVDGNDQGINNVEVEAYIPNKFWPVKNADKAIQARHSTETNSAGYWELQIFGNDIVLTDQGDSSSYWMVTAEDQIFKHKVTVSSDSSTQLMVPDDD